MACKAYVSGEGVRLTSACELHTLATRIWHDRLVLQVATMVRKKTVSVVLVTPAFCSFCRQRQSADLECYWYQQLSGEPPPNDIQCPVKQLLYSAEITRRTRSGRRLCVRSGAEVWAELRGKTKMYSGDWYDPEQQIEQARTRYLLQYPDADVCISLQRYHEVSGVWVGAREHCTDPYPLPESAAGAY